MFFLAYKKYCFRHALALVFLILSAYGSELCFANSPQTEIAHLLALAARTSKSMPYGPGVHAAEIAREHVMCEKTAIRNYIQAAKSAHCGNFSFVFIHDLARDTGVTAIGLKSRTGAIHNIVQVRHNNQYNTVDPTLGVVYPCSVHELISSGACRHQDAQVAEPIPPKFGPYFGAKFFYHASILMEHHSIEAMKKGYC